MIRLQNQLNICASHQLVIHERIFENRTSILDTMLRQDAVTPVRHAADSLHAARPLRGAWIRFLVFFNVFTIIEMEALSEATTHLVPLLAVGVACKRILRH